MGSFLGSLVRTLRRLSFTSTKNAGGSEDNGDVRVEENIFRELRDVR